jgi:DNA repair protein RadC
MNDDILRSVRPTPGSLNAVFVDAEGEVVLRVDISEGTAHVDELFLQHVVMLTSDVGVAGVTFVISRPDGRPTRVDRRLWQELRTRLAGAPTALIDVIVVGQERWWSAASGRVAPLVRAA